ncbi:coiled-coil domain-containing protein-domain-containing protein [Lineolata rhizophorae]|uniref:Coiled-coil domain-containing protein-domain-containing protein n=1 Tax=Lineolata rhizophorae TaxID=578093 RepID=A0A6A6NQL0_9PEZI|nr:coiled-coil domain-containing protein-domain-containing protein [Lineolata rhizophorae]
MPTHRGGSRPRDVTKPNGENDEERSHRIRIKNRRKHYLDKHPEYFGPDLELADPLLYDRMIRRFQTPAEREAEGRAKGYSGVLEADLWRSEAKRQALEHPDPHASVSYQRGPNGEIVAEDRDEVPENKEEAREWWRWAMEMRFLRGEDNDFDYGAVDESEDWDDWAEIEREREEKWFDEEEPSFAGSGDEGEERMLNGETGIQDF